jgi:hypothetical protein
MHIMGETAIAPPKPKAKGQIAKAAGSGSGASASNCKNCHKTGLAILPVTGSPALRSVFDKHRADAAATAALKTLDGRLATPDRTLSWDFMRVLPAGYLYVLKSNMVWDAYVVGVDGLLNKMPVEDLDETPDGTQLSVACKREGHSNIGPQFFCVDPSTHSQIWVAFSRHRWTQVVRERFKNDTDGCRTARMTRVDMQAAAKGDVGKGRTVSMAMEANEVHLLGVADFMAQGVRERFSRELNYPLRDRSGQAPALAKRMADASAKTPARQGIVLYLPDPIGTAEELNCLRLNAVQAHQAWVAGGPCVDGTGANPERPWARQSAMHVAYIEAWAEHGVREKQKAGTDGLRGLEQQIREQGGALGSMTKQQFDQNYGHLVNQPVQNPRGGLNPWSGAKWEPRIDPRTGKPVPSGMGYVRKSDAYWNALTEYHAKPKSADRLDRYRKHLRYEELKAFNTQYETQEQAWGKHIAALDKDYIAYVESRWLTDLLAHDFESNKKFADARHDAKQVKEHLLDTLARLQATERALGGAAVSEHSLNYLQKAVEKKVDDKDNWIARALLEDFGFLKKVQEGTTDPGTAPDLYEIAIGAYGNANKDGREEWLKLWESVKEQASASAQNLALPIQQAINHLRMRQLAGAAGNPGKALALMEEIAKKELVWVRAAALHEYLATTKKHYSIKVRWTLGEYLDAQVNAIEQMPGFEMQERPHGSRTQVRSEMRKARKQLEKLSRDPRFSGQVITVPLIVESGALQARAARAGEGTLSVFSDDLLGARKPPVSLPKSVVEELVQRRPAGRGSAFKLVATREGLFTGFALFLSGRELFAALQGLSKSGFEQADAVASLASAISGIFGGAAEVGAMVTQGAFQGGTQATGAVTAAAFSRAIALRFGAGLLGAAGAWADGASSFIKAARAGRAGDKEAASHYVGSGATLLAAGGGSAAGAFVTWRAALAARGGQQVVQLLGRQAVAGVARGVVLRTAAGALLGASLTGVGLVLFAAGILWALYAASLEDDDNEIFLDRTYWGKHERKEGAFGGARSGASKDAAQAWMAGGIDAEMMALGNLALGFKAEITDWNGEWFSNDIIEFRFMFGVWSPDSYRFEYRLEAFQDKERKGTPVLVRTGPMPGEVPKKEDEDSEVYELSIQHLIDDDRFQAVRLTFSMFKDGELVGSDALWATVDD